MDRLKQIACLLLKAILPAPFIKRANPYVLRGGSRHRGLRHPYFRQ
jgi:hypothetical protein